MSALPFTFIMLLMCWGLIKALRSGCYQNACALQAARITPRADPESTQLATALRPDHALSAYVRKRCSSIFTMTVNKAFLKAIQSELKTAPIYM